MRIIEDKESAIQNIINTEKLKDLLFSYRFPLILAAIGIILLLVGLIIGFKTLNTSSGVVFTEASASAQAKIHVDVEGAVIAPGVYELPEGSRITQVLTFAGGLAADADRDWIAKNMNLAVPVTDGGKIYIPSLAEASEGKIQNSIQSADKTQNLSNPNNLGNLLGVTTGKVNINISSQAELESLPGIGPVSAAKIVSGRPYQSIDELKNKKIIGNALFEKIKDLLVVY